MIEWLFDPTVLTGLTMLILLEIVLGIDNLVFIAILADKLPPHQRDRARVLGLALALIMRLILLASLSWLVTLTRPLFVLFDHGFSGRDLILLLGGLFLLFKATLELHERLEGRDHSGARRAATASFGMVVAQIVALDAVFSLDSVITAVGMVDDLAVMMVAVTVAMAVMLVASKPLTAFVNAHPTLIVLCLGFLLMIGFSLSVEGLGFHIPKGYLYAAIGFSILIELLNQLAWRNKRKWLLHGGDLRTRTAETVLRLLGGGHRAAPENGAASPPDALLGETTMEVFGDEERDMIRNVLTLADTNIKALMTPRREVQSIDLGQTPEQQRQQLIESPFSRLLVVEEGRQDEPLGIVQKKTLLAAVLRGEPPDVRANLEKPAVLLETQTAIEALETFRREQKQLAFIVDEFGTLEGIVTLTDILEEIAGDLPEADQDGDYVPAVLMLEANRYSVDASENIETLNGALPEPLPRSKEYTTLAGLLLQHFQHVPEAGESLEIPSWRATVLESDPLRIVRVELALIDNSETIGEEPTPPR